MVHFQLRTWKEKFVRNDKKKNNMKFHYWQWHEFWLHLTFAMNQKYRLSNTFWPLTSLNISFCLFPQKWIVFGSTFFDCFLSFNKQIRTPFVGSAHAAFGISGKCQLKTKREIKETKRKKEVKRAKRDAQR